MITSLQIILAIVGVVFVAAVIAYNLWQERKYRQEASRLFSTKREDILLGESVSTENHDSYAIPSRAEYDEAAGWRVDQAEPSAPMEDTTAKPSAQAPIMPLGERPVESPKGLDIQVEGPLREVEDEGLVVPTHAETVPVTPTKPTPSAPVATTATPEAAGFHAESGLDEAVEYVARVRFAKPAVTSYVSLIEGLRRIGKPIRAMGKRPGEGWEPLSGHPSHALEGLEIGIQLADRNGAITSTQIERFCKLLYDFAAAEGGAVSCPDKHAALQQARDLDLFCMEVDVLIGLTVASRDGRPLRGEDIHRLATEAGLVLERDGAYYLLDEDGRALFSMANQEENPFRAGGEGLTTSGVTLLFDVPKVRDGLAVFDRMTGLGLHMAEVMRAQLVDDNGRVVTRDNLQKDRNRLADYYARMVQRGIEAGGDRALRLFA
ncbi:MAG: cell division protein ZipA C-terminal FtsZ-binding domain-containing protein [Thiobacillaceae bacterium]